MGWRNDFQACSRGCWQEAQFLTLWAPAQEGPDVAAAILSKWATTVEQDTETKTEAAVLLECDFGSNLLSLVLYFFGHKDQPWYSVVRDYTSQWGSLEAILETGCHSLYNPQIN